MEEEGREGITDQGNSGNEKDPFGLGSLREVSYAVLFCGAVFIVSAMETGSYRTPWPVAILTTLAGIGLYAYALTGGKKQS